MRNLIIIGSGPAGLTAAIYTARANLYPLVVEGPQPGGQITSAPEIENFPGFPEGITGYELIELIKKQALRFNAEIISGIVTRVDFSVNPLLVEIDGKPEHSMAVIIATGASAQYLGLESEKRFIGKGISACATCDGFFYRNKDVIVIGGGDSALQEAFYLSKMCRKITVIHRRDQFRASKILQERIKADPRIDALMDTVVTEFLPDDSGLKIGSARILNKKTGESSLFRTDGVFVAIGRKPSTDIFRDHLLLDASGNIVVHDGTQTSVKGVFAAGDAANPLYRQAITAAGTGCMAAFDAERYLEKVKN
jgi:thioredoxin reductase (NADPH)